MTCRNKIIYTFIFFLFFLHSIITAMNIVNTLIPYDSLIDPLFIRPNFSHKYRWLFAGYAETGYHNAKGFNNNGDHVNALRIWNCQQNGLSMLEGVEFDTNIGQLRSALLDSNNGVRGHFNVDGDLKLDFNFSFAAHIFFAQDWSIGLYLPIYKMHLKNVIFQDLTPDLDNDDKLVRELLTNNFAANVQELGNLHIGGWTRQGVGDLALILNWFRDFKQYKPFLKWVRVNWRWGIVFPTGLRSDEDLIFAVPFGYDGAFAMPFGLGLDLTLGSYFKTGIDIQLTEIFGNKRTWRIKTQEDQTELLLLHKACAFKNHRLVQRFNLYVKLYRFFKGLSFTVGYQFLKQGETEIVITSQQFSSAIANTSQKLKEFTMHHVIAKATYDFGVHRIRHNIRPEWSIYVRNPFNGKNVVLIPTIGTVFSLDF